jgi:hypothetical protein
MKDGDCFQYMGLLMPYWHGSLLKKTLVEKVYNFQSLQSCTISMKYGLKVVIKNLFHSFIWSETLSILVMVLVCFNFFWNMKLI